ncbi:MAG: putative prokaryotic signal transducing protein [Acidobacteria bacterium]|jgi:hypothetical protein|nr:putative prokaryotic signal transducing protein [Acidobacteriota bacterium]
MSDQLVCVTTFHYRHEAELARGALEASGIEATIMADDMGSEIPSLDLHQGVAIFVREADLESARQVLDLAE